MFEIKCNNCGETYHVDEQHIGKKILCTKCKHTITIEKEKSPAYNTLDNIKVEVKKTKKNPFKGYMLALIIIVFAVPLYISINSNFNKVVNTNKVINTNTNQYQPYNGEVMSSNSQQGNGELEIKNGTNMDAILKLVNNNTLCTSV